MRLSSVDLRLTDMREDCVICDLDGTIALHMGRSPYEWDKIPTDKLSEHLLSGNIYEYDGSHGCVNLSFDLAKTIYENAYAGMIVIVV